LGRKFKEYVYNWEKRFSFTSRFCQIQVVALLALYYFFIYFAFNIVRFWLSIQAYDVSKFKTQVTLNFSEPVCYMSNKLCHKANIYLPIVTMDLARPLVDSLLPELKASVNIILFAPLVGALAICLIQQFCSIRECKKHLLELYRGECEYVKKMKSLDNAQIAESSFHFGG
jgi:hypothetical protein